MTASTDAASDYSTEGSRSSRISGFTRVNQVFAGLAGAPIVVWGSILFCMASTTRFLYSINQNTKFLHGLAKAFPERLGVDWTANTVDGLPVFSALVFVIARYGQPFFFYMIEAVLLACLFCSSFFVMIQVARTSSRSLHYRLGCAATLVVLAGLRPPFLFVDGVGWQYLVGGYLQPSEFGVLFITSIALALARQNNWAIVAGAVPAAFHPGYIPLSIIMVCSIVISERTSPRYLLAAIALIVVPQADLALRFAPTDSRAFLDAASTLAFERIPQHADPALWLRAEAYVKLGLGVIGFVLAPRGFLRVALGALLVWAVAGTIAVASMRWANLALVAPWRTSVIIVPVSTIVILARLGELSFRWSALARFRPMISALFVLLAVVIAGKGVATKSNDYFARRIPAYVEFVLANHQPDDVYLTNPYDEGFRLEAMTAQFVSWKTHPYLDREVLEWRQRVILAREVFGGLRGAPKLDCAALSKLARMYPVTHVLLKDADAAQDATCSILEPGFFGDGGRIFRINRTLL